MKSKIILLYVPFPSESSARKLIKSLLENQFAVCVQSYKVQSNYIWEGKIVKSNEVILIIKTNARFKAKAIKQVKETHPYEIPCIIELEGSVNKNYNDWMNSMLF